MVHAAVAAFALVLHLIHDDANLWPRWGWPAAMGLGLLAANAWVQARPWQAGARVAAGFLCVYLGTWFTFVLIVSLDYVWIGFDAAEKVLLTVYFPITDFVNSLI